MNLMQDDCVQFQEFFSSQTKFEVNSQPRDSFTCNKMFDSALGSEGPGHA